MKRIYADSEIRGPKLVNNIATYKAIMLTWDFIKFHEGTALSYNEHEDGTIDIYYEFFDIRDAFIIEEIIEAAQEMNI